ncbi:8868_t:CDS:2, partial [Cetraspora pellucida]
MNGIINKAYKTFSKNQITCKLTHFGRGQKYLNEARDQKSQNPESSALLYKYALNNLEIAHNNRPNSDEIKEILIRAREEYEEILKELSLSENDYSKNEPSDDLQRFIENKFFSKNYIPEKNLPLNEDDEPSNTQQLARKLRRNDISDEQKMKLCILVRKIIEKEELYRHLVDIFITKIKKSNFLYPSLLEGLSHIIRQANPKHLKPNDLVCILNILNVKFKNLHPQDKDQLIEITRTLGWLFDVMADCKVRDLKYEELCKPLYDTFKKLKSDNNQELVYLAGYA